jgi:hypothetical protein
VITVPTSAGAVTFRGLAHRECSSCGLTLWCAPLTVVNRNAQPPGLPEAHLNFCGDCIAAALAIQLGQAHVVAGGDASDLSWPA